MRCPPPALAAFVLIKRNLAMAAEYCKIGKTAIMVSKNQIMALSIKQVRYFIATADAGQVSQAAIELNVSQSAVTAAIKQLEEDLGVTLFLRQPSGVSLTAEGARFLQHARNIMAAVNAAANAPLTEDTALDGHGPDRRELHGRRLFPAAPLRPVCPQLSAHQGRALRTAAQRHRERPE